MNGAELLCDVLLAHDVDTCFANPGTSEMHFVAALDRNPRMRCVLGLSEGVVTGAADGYARMTGKPAATLLHLGPGLANGLANLHNARRANSPIINVVGDHAGYHLPLDAPLTSDIESLARPMSHWVGRASDAALIREVATEAWSQAVSTPGIATLILPADAAWGNAGQQRATPSRQPQPVALDISRMGEAARALSAPEGVAILLGGRALQGHALELAGRIAAATGVRIFAETGNARMERGAGRVPVDRIPYPVDLAVAFLADVQTLILVGAKPPVAFFAYPGKPGRLTRPDCRIVDVAGRGHDLEAVLEELAERVGAGDAVAPVSAYEADDISALPDGPLTPAAIAHIVAATLPDGAVVCDESLTSGADFFARSHTSRPHDFLSLTGGAIGIGIPLATGAAIGAPGRKVVALQADGSGMYTVQGLWTQARERLDVVTIVFANRAYRILETELRNVGVSDAGPNARRMLELVAPSLDWIKLAEGMGVEGRRVDTVAGFRKALSAAFESSGPFLIEAVI